MRKGFSLVRRPAATAAWRREDAQRPLRKRSTARRSVARSLRATRPRRRLHLPWRASTRAREDWGRPRFLRGRSLSTQQLDPRCQGGIPHAICPGGWRAAARRGRYARAALLRTARTAAAALPRRATDN